MAKDVQEQANKVVAEHTERRPGLWDEGSATGGRMRPNPKFGRVITPREVAASEDPEKYFGRTGI